MPWHVAHDALNTVFPFAASAESIDHGHFGTGIDSIHARTSTNASSIAVASATESVQSSDAAIMIRA